MLGFDAEHGFTPVDLQIYARHVEAMVRDEAAMLADRLGELGPDELSRRIERVLPVIGALIAVAVILLACWECYRVLGRPADAREILSVGFSKPHAEVNAEELVAWTSVARVILNLHETITRY